jgi:HEAT repeat protein
MAQALVALEGAKGLERIFERIRRAPAPEALLTYAAGAAVKLVQEGRTARETFTKDLLALTLHHAAEVRLTAAMNLDALGDAGAIEAIVKESRSGKPLTRQRMAEALGFFGRPAVARLKEMAQDELPSVRSAAEASLKRIPM